MPVVTLPLQDAYESSTRPIAVQIAKYILKEFPYPSNTRIVFPGDTGKIAQAKSQMTDEKKEENYMPTDNTITISVDEHYIEDRVLSTAIARFPEENKRIFVDDDLKIYMNPIYTPMEMTISFRLRFRDKAAAERWRNHIKARYSSGRAEVIHTVNYHYGIPSEYIYMIVEMYKLREAVAPLNETMKDWFGRCLDDRATTITNQIGNLNKAVIGIAENQIGLLGWYDFTYVPDKNEREADTGTYISGFDYKIQFDKVTDVFLHYPVMIHNQVLPKTLRDDQPPPTLDYVTKSSQLSRLMFQYMQSENPRYLSGIEGWHIPEWDDWIVPAVPRGCSTLLNVLIEVDPLDKKDVIDLNDLGDELEFNTDIFPFLQGEAPYIAEIGKSIFYFTMYEFNTPLGMHVVTMDSTLKVRTVDDMNLRMNNRFHFGIITDFNMLSREALDRLRSNPTALYIILDVILKGYPKPTINSNGTVSWSDMMNIRDLLITGNNVIPSGAEHRRLTVGDYTLISRKRAGD